MAEATMFMFTHKELAEAMVKKQGLHEGIWGISIKFGLGAIHAAEQSQGGEVLPAAVIPVMAIGIRKFDEENSLSVDASKVNPRTE